MTPESSIDSERSTSSRWPERIVSAVLGIAVGVIAALIIGLFQSREPHLTHSATDSVPFIGSSGEVSIYQVTISNDGKKEVYDVACAVRIPSAKIDQFRLTADPLLGSVGTVSGDTLNVQIPNLNPSESIQISLLASGSRDLPSRPIVVARGRGIVSSEKANATSNKLSWTDTGLVAVTAALALTTATTFLQVFRKKTGAPSGAGSTDQRQVLAYLCRMFGLSDLANKYADMAQETSYWSEADRLGQVAIDVGGETMSRIERMLLALVDYKEATLWKSSKAVVYYNLAFISHANNDQPAKEKYLRLAK